jgi:hypothetical protein
MDKRRATKYVDIHVVSDAEWAHFLRSKPMLRKTEYVRGEAICEKLNFLDFIPDGANIKEADFIF